ncbi:MAG TPA: TetR family transcriptional regulator [Clostridia bacterium]|nr:TetR family transcriptional regulator [Clostridia bacterium]HPQ47300.1 TetR family transcriptional regulator [Clostridia bacterium]
MEFQRARSDEQKDIRIKQISEAALELLKTQKYEDITLAGIAKNLSFTRANLYKYISSKEEIFLYIILDEIEKWKKNLDDSFHDVINPDKEWFAQKWSETVFENRLMIQTMSLLYTIFEKNVTLEKLVDFKIRLFSLTMGVVKLLTEIFPRFTMETAFHFLKMQLFYSTGLYPTTVENEMQKKAIELAGVEFVAPDFTNEMKEFTMILFLKFDV